MILHYWALFAAALILPAFGDSSSSSAVVSADASVTIAEEEFGPTAIVADRFERWGVQQELLFEPPIEATWWEAKAYRFYRLAPRPLGFGAASDRDICTVLARELAGRVWEHSAEFCRHRIVQDFVSWLTLVEAVGLLLAGVFLILELRTCAKQMCNWRRQKPG